MKVHHSALTYLLLFCSLCSVITQDASPQDTNIDLDDSDGFKYLYYLNYGHFEGTWQNTLSVQTFENFEEDSGFFVSKYLNCVMSDPAVKLSLTVYDGKYVNGDSLTISICHRFSPSFHFDSANTSFIGMNVPLKVTGKGATNKKCPSDVTIYIIDRTFEAATFDVQFAISSPECEISIITDILTYSTLDIDQAQFYMKIFYALLILEVVILVFAFPIIDKPEIQASLVSIFWLIFWRLLIIWINLRHIWNGTYGGLLLRFVLIIVILVALVITYPAIIVITDNDTSTQDCSMPALLLILYSLFNWNILNDSWAYFSSCLYLVPQIIMNCRSKERFRLSDLLLLLVFMPSLLFHIGYYSMHTDNFERLRPDSDFFWAYIGLFAGQVIILVFQSIEKRSGYQLQVNEMVPVEGTKTV